MKPWKVINSKVVGVTFEGRQEVIAALTVDTPIKLVRDPENPYDSNAIKVVTATMEKSLGFIKKELAAELAFLMDKGYTTKVSIVNLTGEGKGNLGVNITIGVYHASPTPHASSTCHFVILINKPF